MVQYRDHLVMEQRGVFANFTVHPSTQVMSVGSVHSTGRARSLLCCCVIRSRYVGYKALGILEGLLGLSSRPGARIYAPVLLKRGRPLGVMGSI